MIRREIPNQKESWILHSESEKSNRVTSIAQKKMQKELNYKMK